jgi:hypothetical protein
MEQIMLTSTTFASYDSQHEIEKANVRRRTRRFATLLLLHFRVAIAGTLGLLPLWVTSEIKIYEGRSLTWLLAKFFPDKMGRLEIKVDNIISNIMAALKTGNNNESDFLRRSVENIMCKAFCRHTKKNSDGMFHDILIPKQNLYYVQGNNVRVMLADGKAKHKMKGALLSMVPFRGSYISLQELHTHIPKNWPG